MKSVIDNLNALAGWTSSGTMSAAILNDHPEYISGGNTSSIIISVPAGNTGKYIQKSITFDPSGYDEVVLSIWSREKTTENPEMLAANYHYKIDFGTGEEYYLPTPEKFSQVSFYISGAATFNKIKITALHNDEDYLCISYLVAVKEQMPLDLFNAARDELRTRIDSYTTLNKFVGNVTALAGDTSISITGTRQFLDRYAVIKITDGINTEYHQIEVYDEEACGFNGLYSGTKILNNFTAANVYLYIPVEFGVDSKDIILPGISIWGITPEMILRGSALEDIFDNFTVAVEGASRRREGHIYKFNILIDVEARHYEILNLMSEVVRKFIAREILWMNGLRYEIKDEGIPTAVEPVESYEFIPKIQYNFHIEFKEEIWTRTILPMLTNPVTTAYILT